MKRVKGLRSNTPVGHHLWLSLPVQSHCVKQPFVWNPSYHESPAALQLTDRNPVWTTRGEDMGEGVRERVLSSLGNEIKRKPGPLFEFHSKATLPWACGHSSLHRPSHNKTWLDYLCHWVKDWLIPGLAIACSLPSWKQSGGEYIRDQEFVCADSWIHPQSQWLMVRMIMQDCT